MSPLSCDQVRDLAAGLVLGALEPNEMHDTRDHLASCPEAHPEMAELGGVVPYLAESVEPVEPPSELRGRIVGAIEAEIRAGRRTEAAADRLISSLRAGSAGPAAVEPAAAAAGGPVALAAAGASAAVGPASAARPPAEVAGSPIGLAARSPVDLAAERARRRSPLRWIAAIAAVVVIAALGAWNVGLMGQLSTAQQEQAAVDRVLAIAQEAGGQAAILVPGATGATGATGGPAGLAAVAPDGSFAMALSGLPPTSGSQVYEAWVIAPSGAPVAVGSFSVGTSGFGSLAAAQVPIDTVLTVGLTREARSGVTTPTLPMVVSGVTTQGS
jgi:hypothetical protein